MGAEASRATVNCVQTQDNRSAPYGELAVAYTDKPVSGWGGLLLTQRYFDRLGLRELLRRALPDGRTSPNQIPWSTSYWPSSPPCSPARDASRTWSGCALMKSSTRSSAWRG